MGRHTGTRVDLGRRELPVSWVPAARAQAAQLTESLAYLAQLPWSPTRSPRWELDATRASEVPPPPPQLLKRILGQHQANGAASGRSSAGTETVESVCLDLLRSASRPGQQSRSESSTPAMAWMDL